jgi:hypothetical protein
MAQVNPLTVPAAVRLLFVRLTPELDLTGSNCGIVRMTLPLPAPVIIMEPASAGGNGPRKDSSRIATTAPCAIKNVRSLCIASFLLRDEFARRAPYIRRLPSDYA